jgi:hypothetical protein
VENCQEISRGDNLHPIFIHHPLLSFLHPLRISVLSFPTLNYINLNMLSKLRMYSLYGISKRGLLAKQVSGKYLATKDE